MLIGVMRLKWLAKPGDRKITNGNLNPEGRKDWKMLEEKTKAEELDELHRDLVGTSGMLTDFDKIIGILVALSEKLDDLDGHSHTIN